MGHTGEKRNGVLVLIAIFKLAKASALVAVGVGALKLLHGNAQHTLTHWMLAISGEGNLRFVRTGLTKVLNLSPRKLEMMSVATFVYAALFVIEGTGLLLRKRWAEYFTLFVTGSFVPLEIYELLHHPSPVKAVTLAINVAVVVYLAWNLKREHRKASRPHGPKLELRPATM